MQVCEWCGTEKHPGDDWHMVTLPGGCCSYPVCDDCIGAAQDRGGGTAFCCRCGRVIAIRDAREVITRSGPWYRRVKITRYECRGGCG